MDTRIKAVTFDEERHKYFWNGHELFGVTGAIGKIMNKSFPDTDIVKLATIYGSDVHKEIENYFNEHDHWFNDSELSSEGAKWIVTSLKDLSNGFLLDRVTSIESELLVSDFEGTASKIDIVMRTEGGKALLFDIKTTSKFDREYCSLQLSVYKHLFEECYDMEVSGMYVLATKAERVFRILPKEPFWVRKILNMNRGM